MKKLKELFFKYEEIISYLFWGGLAFLLSMLLYWLFFTVMGMGAVPANTIDWIICVLFTFFTNRTFVFKSKVKGAKERWKEFIEFVLARLFTLLLEDLIIWIGVDRLGFTSPLASTVVKLIGQFVVIVTNYILSKLWIFKKKDEAQNDTAVINTEDNR